MLLILVDPLETFSSSLFQVSERDSFLRKAVIRIELTIVASRRHLEFLVGHDHPPIIWKKLDSKK